MHFDHISALPTPSESFLPPYTVLILRGVCGSGAASLPIPHFFHCPTLWGLVPHRLLNRQSDAVTQRGGMLTRRCKGSPCWVLVLVRGNEWGQSELLPLCPHRKRGGWYVRGVMITRMGCWKQNTQDSEEWPPFSRNTHSVSETSDFHKTSSWFALIPTLCEILWII